MEKEVWIDIPNYGGLYIVSDLGRVKSVRSGKMLVQDICNHKYYRVCLHNNGNRKKYYTHQLVAISFLGHKTHDRKVVIDHINNIKTDNRLKNIHIVTSRDNVTKDIKNKTSKYTGVSKHSQYDKWVSSIWIEGVKKYLGIFDNEFDAHLTYQKELKYYGKGNKRNNTNKINIK